MCVCPYVHARTLVHKCMRAHVRAHTHTNTHQFRSMQAHVSNYTLQDGVFLLPKYTHSLGLKGLKPTSKFLPPSHNH